MKIFKIDYARMEAEVLARLQSEEDIHSKEASEIFGVPIDKVTPQMRMYSKLINYAKMYSVPHPLKNHEDNNDKG